MINSNLPNVLTLSLLVAAAAIAVSAGVLRRRSVRRDSHAAHADLKSESAVLRLKLKRLPQMLEAAKRARVDAAEAGRLPDDELQQWLQDYKADVADLAAMAALLPPADADFAGVDAAEADVKLMELLDASLRVGALTAKYKGSGLPQDAEPPADAAALPLLPPLEAAPYHGGISQ